PVPAEKSATPPAPAAAPPPPAGVVPASTPPAPASSPATAGGAKGTVATAPIKVEATPATFRPAPPRKGERDDVTPHRCLQEDTWASISKKYLLTDRYAEALQAYNRQSPQASERLKRDGQPAPGDEVFIPPPWKLQEDHGLLIRQEEPPAAATPQ